MPRILDPFRFVLIAIAGWMNQRQLHTLSQSQLHSRRPPRLDTAWPSHTLLGMWTWANGATCSNRPLRTFGTLSEGPDHRTRAQA